MSARSLHGAISGGVTARQIRGHARKETVASQALLNAKTSLRTALVYQGDPSKERRVALGRRLQLKHWSAARERALPTIYDEQKLRGRYRSQESCFLGGSILARRFRRSY